MATVYVRGFSAVADRRRDGFESCKGSTNLEAVTNICLIVTCLIVGAAVVQRWLGGEPVMRTQAEAELEYRPGDLVAPLGGVDWSAEPLTLLVVISTTCRFCEEDMSTYARLARERRSKQFQLVLAGLEPASVLTEYARIRGVHADSVTTVDRAFRVRSTPTALVVGTSGRVKQVWRGALRNRAAELESALRP